MDSLQLFSMALKIGDKAPDFTLKDSFDNEISLSDFKGKKVIIYFYPKDNTPVVPKRHVILKRTGMFFKKIILLYLV